MPCISEVEKVQVKVLEKDSFLGEYIMARVCEICGKGAETGNTVSHAHNKNRRRWLPNLQKVRRVTDSGRVVRIKACTRCIRSGAVVKPA